MSISIPRLRRWFAGAAILVCVVVAGFYFYARHRVRNALKEVPGKIGIEVQQSAQGFTISKSEQGRTLFTLQASKAVQFKLGGHAELHHVSITFYGTDSSRFDQIYGEDFEYDPQTGNVTSRGEVSIDLQPNPQGSVHPDQAPPRELKNPIHLKATGIVFNQKSGDAWTDGVIEFRVPQASGSAVGARYVAKENTLTLESQVRMIVNGPDPATITAQEAIIKKNPREIVLSAPRGESPDEHLQADELTLFLRDDNTLDHAVASGNVRTELSRKPGSARAAGSKRRSLEGTGLSKISAQKVDVRVGQDGEIQNAIFSGTARFENNGAQILEADAGKAIVAFGAGNIVTRIHADEQVRLQQRPGTNTPASQTVEVTAPAMDFFVADGDRLARAETIGTPQITLASSDNAQGATRITADRFTALFDPLGQLSRVIGNGNSRVVNQGGSQPERVSTSDQIEAFFRPGTGIESLLQQGHFTYRSETQQSFADHARYTPADQMLTLEGSPRIVDSGMETTARVMRLNRATGNASASGDVKTTYSDLKAQPNGAFLASSDPVHVTAQSLNARSSLAIATYSGNVRLWQNANIVEAPSIQFRKDQRTIMADSNSSQKVTMVLIGTDKKGKAAPVAISSDHLAYTDSERKAHFDGSVTVKGSDLTIASRQMDVFLGQTSSTGATPPPASAVTPARLEKIIASGAVQITQPNRRASGEQLTYTASDDKFVLTGGPPSIFDAEHGKITAVSLTLFRRDDRVVVEGDSNSPAVTQTRVVR